MAQYKQLKIISFFTSLLDDSRTRKKVSFKILVVSTKELPYFSFLPGGK
jgi:hypothetical protein